MYFRQHFQFLSILFSASTSLCAHRIIGGEDAYAAQFPFVAAINVQTESSRFFCGGALVTNVYVLTSGHCVNNATLFTIYLGSNHLTSDDANRVIVSTSDYILHPDFNPKTIQNDLGLIKLRLPVDLTTYLSIISFPSFQIYDNVGVTVVGWGQTSDYEPDLSETLKYVYLNAMSNTECKIYYGSQLDDNMVCVAGNYNQGSCMGDTGGPLIEYVGRSARVVGVASFVSGNGCESTDPSGYTRTWPYVDWLVNVTSSSL